MKEYYDRYKAGKYFLTYVPLEAKLSAKAKNQGFLELEDLVDIVNWGGGQYGIPVRVKTNNSADSIIDATRQTILHLNNPLQAFRDLAPIKQWGPSYSTKTLRFICPEKYPAFDSYLRDNIKTLPTKGYMEFIDLCNWFKPRIKEKGPRQDGEWFIADIEMALFQFVSDGGQLVDK